ERLPTAAQGANPLSHPLSLKAVLARGQIELEPRTLYFPVFADRDDDGVSHQHRAGHDIEGRPVSGRGDLAVLCFDKNALPRLHAGKLLGSPLATSAETGLARVEGRE